MKTFQQFMEQTPHMNLTPFNVAKAQAQAKGGISHRRHVHQEIGAEARAQQSAKNARMKAILSRESVESVSENVSSGSARRARFGVKQRVSSSEVITNTERQNKIAQHFADHAAKKKAAGEEAHSAATKAGKSPMEAETARQRAHRQYEKDLKKGG